jgi:hypothetical protein
MMEGKGKEKEENLSAGMTAISRILSGWSVSDSDLFTPFFAAAPPDAHPILF